MIPARIAHATARRVRLRVPSRKGDAGFFEEVARRLHECAAVEDVAINPRTGSVLVRHRGDFDAVTAHATSRGLFSVERIDGECAAPSDALAVLRAPAGAIAAVLVSSTIVFAAEPPACSSL